MCKMSIAHEIDPLTADPFSPQYWGDLIGVTTPEKTPIHNLPDSKTWQTAGLTMRSYLISLRSGDMLPADMTDGFRFHPESCRVGDVIIYDVERLVQQSRKVSAWVPSRLPKDKLDALPLVPSDTFGILSLAPDNSLKPVKLEAVKHTKDDGRTLTSSTYSREAGIGIVVGEPGRHALLTFCKDFFSKNEQPAYRWINRNDPGIVGFSTKRIAAAFGQPEEITERVRSIKHFEGSADNFDSLLHIVQICGKAGSIALR